MDVKMPKDLRAPKGRQPQRAEQYVSPDAEPNTAPVDVPDAEMAVEYDPWVQHNFLHIKAHPDGYVLRWCNPQYRAGRGWRGWEPVRYSSEIGQNLSEYLMEPPHRFEGVNQMDDFVRAGNDLILCKIKVGIFNARRAAIAAKRSKIMGHLEGADVVNEDAPDRDPDYIAPGKAVPGVFVPKGPSRTPNAKISRRT